MLYVNCRLPISENVAHENKLVDQFWQVQEFYAQIYVKATSCKQFTNVIYFS